MNFGGALDTAGYKFYSNGLVALKGSIKTGTIGNVAFTLPVGLRPANTRPFSVDSNGAMGAVTVETDGDVIPSSGSSTHVALDGIIFEAEQ